MIIFKLKKNLNNLTGLVSDESIKEKLFCLLTILGPGGKKSENTKSVNMLWFKIVPGFNFILLRNLTTS